jgi:DNA mismatch endonuclease, patch repair protein
MADIFSKKKRSAVMSAIRSHGNKATEVRMVALFRAHGITGWRRQQKLRVEGLRVERKNRCAKRTGDSRLKTPDSRPAPFRVSVDFVFRRERVCVFVDGCFWHACPKHGTQPSGNRVFWKKKLVRNAERDREVSRALRMAGWTVLRVWEHDLATRHWRRVAGRVTRALGG